MEQFNNLGAYSKWIDGFSQLYILFNVVRLKCNVQVEENNVTLDYKVSWLKEELLIVYTDDWLKTCLGAES